MQPITSLAPVQGIRLHVNFKDGLVKKGRNEKYEQRKHCESTQTAREFIVSCEA
jgi:hypothetical protein